MGRLKPPGTLAAAVVALVVTAAGFGVEAAQSEADAPSPLGPGEVTIRLGIEHSLFDVDEIRVVEGTRIHFVIDNRDPIGHELIVGDEEVHARHEHGNHPFHPPIPGEVSVEPNTEAVTFFDFDEPGIVEFACHLPRHYDYGMHGKVVVEPASEDAGDAA